jgi:hypothetical protein
MTLKLMLGSASLPGGYSKEEMEGLKTMDEFQTTGSGYARIQGSRPQV